MKITKEINLSELKILMENFFGDMVKGVVDIEKGLLALDSELHVDLELALLQQGSKQQDLWGINLYPELYDSPDFLEFDSMINIRPNQNNRSRSVESLEIQEKIKIIVNNAIKND